MSQQTIYFFERHRRPTGPARIFRAIKDEQGFHDYEVYFPSDNIWKQDPEIISIVNDPAQVEEVESEDALEIIGAIAYTNKR